jgi:hypothetical protein
VLNALGTRLRESNVWLPGLGPLGTVAGAMAAVGGMVWFSLAWHNGWFSSLALVLAGAGVASVAGSRAASTRRRRRKDRPEPGRDLDLR